MLLFPYGKEICTLYAASIRCRGYINYLSAGALKICVNCIPFIQAHRVSSWRLMRQKLCNCGAYQILFVACDCRYTLCNFHLLPFYCLFLQNIYMDSFWSVLKLPQGDLLCITDVMLQGSTSTNGFCSYVPNTRSTLRLFYILCHVWHISNQLKHPTPFNLGTTDSSNMCFFKIKHASTSCA